MNFDNNPDLIPFEVKFSLVERIDADSGVDEGIDVKKNGSSIEVAYDKSHNSGIDSTLAHNPTKTTIDVNVSGDAMNVYSVMQRVPLENSIAGSDGNPLLYAFKNENRYTFRSDADKDAVRNDIQNILDKFVKSYFSSAGTKIVTVVVPSGNILNNSFAGWFKFAAEKAGKRLVIHDDILLKMSTNEVRDELFDNGSSEFISWLSDMSLNKAMAIKKKTLSFLDAMDKQHAGTFSYHFVKDPEIRNHISKTMKLSSMSSTSNEYSDINDSDIILIDDSISRGSSLKEAYALLTESYHPKSVTGLTLFSPNRK